METIKRKKYIIFLLTIVFVMTIGFAVLSTTLTINGTSTINSSTWNVKFQNIVLDSLNNVTATTAPSITDNTSINFSVALSKPGDKYSFTVDVVNTGGIDAMINTINNSTLTTEQSKLLDYSVTYIDGVAIQEKDKLVKTTGSETIIVIIKYKTDVTAEDLPSSIETLNLTFSLNYVQADSTAQDITHTPLQNFISKAKAGNATESDVGTTFNIDMGTYGTHTLRVANVSTPSECSNEGFSQTACGVVLEFADLVIYEKMNATSTNVGGYPGTDMYIIINHDIFYSLPPNIRNSIIDTKTISSHGSTSGEENYITIEKMYLLSTHEVFENGENITIGNDTSWDLTRQLDYYYNNGVTVDSYTATIKSAPNNDSWHWWLRSADNSTSTRYYRVTSTGSLANTPVYMKFGVSPAFRIA